jgi:predicted dehydrogenase
MNVTVNAGSVPPDSWVHDPVVGGGRIVGEACHFVDLMVHLARAPVSTVAATMQGVQAFLREDQVSISLAFGDGSVGTVNYFGNGPRSYPKECIELFCEGRVLRIDDFRVTTGYGWRGFRQYRSPRQDKGHENECQAFVGRCRSGGEPLIRLDEMVNVTLACFAGVLSARECRTIHLEKEFPEFYCGGGNG